MEASKEKTTDTQIERVTPHDIDLSAAKGSYEVKAVQDSRYAAAVAQDKPSPGLGVAEPLKVGNTVSRRQRAQ